MWSELVRLKLQTNGRLLFARLHGMAKCQCRRMDTGLLSASEVRGGRAADASVHLVAYRETV